MIGDRPGADPRPRGVRHVRRRAAGAAGRAQLQRAGREPRDRPLAGLAEGDRADRGDDLDPVRAWCSPRSRSPSRRRSARRWARPEPRTSCACLPSASSISGLVATPAAMLQREFRAGRRMLIDQVVNWLGAFVSIATALAGMGAMSLAVGRVAGALVGMVMFLQAEPVRFGFDRAIARRLLGFGLPLAGSSIVVFAREVRRSVRRRRACSARSRSASTCSAFNLSNWPVTVLLAARARRLARGVRAPPARSARAAERARLLGRAAHGDHAAHLPRADAAPPSRSSRSSTGRSGPRPPPRSAGSALLAGLRILFELFYDYFVVLGSTRVVFTVQVIWFVALVPALYAGAQLWGMAGAAAAHVVVAGAHRPPAVPAGAAPRRHRVAIARQGRSPAGRLRRRRRDRLAGGASPDLAGHARAGGGRRSRRWPPSRWSSGACARPRRTYAPPSHAPVRRSAEGTGSDPRWSGEGERSSPLLPRLIRGLGQDPHGAVAPTPTRRARGARRRDGVDPRDLQGLPAARLQEPQLQRGRRDRERAHRHAQVAGGRGRPQGLGHAGRTRERARQPDGRRRDQDHDRGGCRAAARSDSSPAPRRPGTRWLRRRSRRPPTPSPPTSP